MLLAMTTSAFFDQMMAALSMTLAYSLVQGVILAALAGLIILLTRKASSAMRYNLLMGALVLFSLGSAITFGLQYSKAHGSTDVTPSIGSVTGNVDLGEPKGRVAVQPVRENYLNNISDYVTTHHNTIVLIWFVIICVKALQLTVGLQNVYRLKRTDIHTATAGWCATMQQMAQRLGIKEKIKLLESGMAKIPMVIGHLKPVILIPVGLLNALSTAEVEAILMHELAHIRRRDYLVNLLQSLVEIVFFFNPAVLWVSQLIKTERENCCDDIALLNNTSKHNYIQALVSCEEYQQGSAAYAIAFSGQKNSLIDRVKRIVNKRNHSLNNFEKSFLTICLVISGLFLSAFAERETIKKTIHEVVKVMVHRNDSAAPIVKIKASPKVVKHLPAPIDTIKTFVKKDMPFDEAAWFRRMDSIKKSAVAKLAARKASATPNSKILGSPDTGRKIISETNVLTNPSVTTHKRLNLKELLKQDSADRSAPPIPAAPAVPNARRTARIMMDEMVKDGLMERGKPLPFSIDDNAFVVNGKKQPDAVAQKYRTLSKSGFPHGATGHPTQSESTMSKIILQMENDKLINATDENISFVLNNDDFIVNGKKQPDEVFQRYLNDFVKKAPGGKMSWSYSNVSSTKTADK